MKRTTPRARIAMLSLGALALGFGAACDDDRRAASVTVTDVERAGETADVSARPIDASGTAGAAVSDGFEDHRSDVRVVLIDVAEIPLLIPSAIVVAEGTRSILVRNESDIERTFAIEGFEDQHQTSIPPGQEVTVLLGDVEPRGIYAIVLGEASGAIADADAEIDASASVDVAAGGAMEPTPSAAAEIGADPDASAAPEMRALGTLIVLPAGTRPASGTTGATGGLSQAY